MANNPINNIDPNGGYMVASDEVRAQRLQFVNKWAEYVISDAGQKFIRANYLRDYEALAKKILRHYDDLGQKDGGQFLEALLRLNNDYLGMGLSGIYLASGSDRLTSAAMLKNKDLLHTLQTMNGEEQRAADMQNVVDAFHSPISNIDAAEQDFVNENNRRQRAYVNEWRTGEQAAFIAALQGVVNMANAPNELANPIFMNPGEPTDDVPLAAATGTNPITCPWKSDNKSKAKGSNYYARMKVKKEIGKALDKIKFDVGLRSGNFIFFDFKFRADKIPDSKKPSRDAFPGRIWGPAIIERNERFRFTFFYIDWGQ